MMDVDRIAERVASKIRGEGGLDGLTKQTAKRRLNSLLAKYSKGIFRDVGWKAVHDIWKALDAGVVNWENTGNRYINDRETGFHSSKEWKFEVYFYDKKGKFQTLYGVITAFAAGTVGDPWDAYDIAAYVS